MYVHHWRLRGRRGRPKVGGSGRGDSQGWGAYGGVWGKGKKEWCLRTMGGGSMGREGTRKGEGHRGVGNTRGGAQGSRGLAGRRGLA